jgi:hypothetical protein
MPNLVMFVRSSQLATPSIDSNYSTIVFGQSKNGTIVNYLPSLPHYSLATHMELVINSREYCRLPNASYEITVEPGT